MCPEGKGGDLIDSAEWIPNKSGEWGKWGKGGMCGGYGCAHVCTVESKYVWQNTHLAVHLFFCFATQNSIIIFTTVMGNGCFVN